MPLSLIDCDIHPLLQRGIESLRPHVARGWHERLIYRESVLIAQNRYSHPAGTVRGDAATPDGRPGGSDPNHLGRQLLDRYGIDVAIMLPLEAALVNVVPHAAEAAVLASAYNDYFAAEWLRADDRLRLAMVVAPQDPTAAAKEVRRVARTKGVVGVWIPLVQILLGNPHFHPIYQAAEEVGLPIVIHPASSFCNYQGCEAPAGGLPTSYAERHVAFAQLGMANLSSLVFDGVFERFPRLRFVFGEFGWSWIASLQWRMDSTWKAMRYDVPWVKRAPSEYISDRVRFTTQPVDEPPRAEYLRQMLAMIGGEDRLIFSTDYPHWDNDDPRLVFRDMPEQFRRKVFVENAVEIYGAPLLGT